MTKQNYSFIIAGLAILVALGSIYFYGFYQKLSSDKAGQVAIDFVNQTLQGQATASLIEVIDEGSVFGIRLKINEKEYYSYLTKKGDFLFDNGFDLREQKEVESEIVSPDVVKSEKPDVKLFVMSYCPYGLQAQKMFLPVYDLLAEKADLKVYFVDYAMHEKEEIDENLRQYCIQEDQLEKYSDYLSCFVEEGDSEGCLSTAGINTTKMNSCIVSTDQEYGITDSYNNKEEWETSFPLFAIHGSLNQEYGVQGSPTVVINGNQVSVNPRSPENFKDIVCSAFEIEPAECSQDLSQDAASTGFGSSQSTASGSCN
jgi:hypothetical protein